MFNKKEITYTFSEFCDYKKMTKAEQIIYDFSKDLDNQKIYLKDNKNLFRVIGVTFGAMLFLEKTVLGAPSTGFSGLDEGAWRIVQIIQACVFWVSLLYTLKSLLLLAVRGEGEWKSVATGFLICVGDYLIPWVFGMVPGLFNF